MFDKAYFDHGLYRRGTNSYKWDWLVSSEEKNINAMGVADLDFPSPPAVQQALLSRAAHGTYGYTYISDEDYMAPIRFWQRRHGLTLNPEGIILLPCVNAGMKLVINALTEPGDGVMILTPLYAPFRDSIAATGRKCIAVPLLRDSDGYYTINYEMVEEKLSSCRLIMFCNPHNPVGRCWKREEMIGLLEIANRNNVCIMSDEIHSDFIYAPNIHTPFLSLQEENIVMMCSASKSFNLAGLQQANCVCKDKRIAKKLRDQVNASGITAGNLFALTAARAAYNNCDEWLDSLLKYLDGNRLELTTAVHEVLPEAVLSPVQATYLGWLDLRAFGLHNRELTERIRKKELIINEGVTFDADLGDGFIRINFGCPRIRIRDAILRIRLAVDTQIN